MSTVRFKLLLFFNLVLLLGDSEAIFTRDDGQVSQSDKAAQPAAEIKFDAKNIDRLRKKVAESEKLAQQSMFEIKLMEMLADTVPNAAAKGLPNIGWGPAKVESASREAKLLDGKSVSSTGDKTSSGVVAQPSEKITDEDLLPVDSSKVKQANSTHLHNDARQASLFQGFRPFNNPLGQTYPLGGGLVQSPSFPQMPSFQSFPSLPTFPRRQQPKTSIIGGGGGPMALTNDNVVVVNVLSSNF